MKSEDVLSKLAYFFNDFVGAVIPGLILTLLFWALHPGLWHYMKLGVAPDSALAILAITGACFAAGHGLLGLYYEAMEPALKKIRWFSHIKGKKTYLVRDTSTIFAELEKKPTFQLTKELVLNKFEGTLTKIKIDIASYPVSEIRNLAMTLSEEGAMLGRRFMFIALLGQGAGAAFLVVAVETTLVWVTCALIPGLQSTLIAYPVWWGYVVQLVALVVVAVVFFRRADGFYSRALETPLLVAPVEILLKKESDESSKKARRVSSRRV